jgi:hypothetical protein
MKGMRTLTAATVGALAAAGACTAVALASGGPPPVPPNPPDVRTVVAHGRGAAPITEPAKRGNRTIERAVRRAGRAALPRAVATARREAEALARAAGLTLGGPIGVARNTQPYSGWYPEEGRFGPGRWCGRVVFRRDGERRSRHVCRVPDQQTAEVIVTFATR